MNRPIESVEDANEFMNWAGLAVVISRVPQECDAPSLDEVAGLLAIGCARTIQDLYRREGKL